MSYHHSQFINVFKVCDPSKLWSKKGLDSAVDYKFHINGSPHLTKFKLYLKIN